LPPARKTAQAQQTKAYDRARSRGDQEHVGARYFQTMKEGAPRDSETESGRNNLVKPKIDK
jgi:hypothetical protein